MNLLFLLGPDERRERLLREAPYFLDVALAPDAKQRAAPRIQIHDGPRRLLETRMRRRAVSASSSSRSPLAPRTAMR